MNVKVAVLSLVMAPVWCFSAPASALNIILTNDDSWNTTNIKAMKEALEQKGHEVIITAPCTGQSGKGGAFGFFKSVMVDESRADVNEFCIGDTDTSKVFKNYVEGTPVMSVLYGIDIAAQRRWGSAPDLVISGPNEGNNVGYINNNSGTLGAAMVSLSRGIPAIAISGNENSKKDPSQGKKIANVVIDIIDKLELTRVGNQPLLPAYTGLNINTPEMLDNNLGYKFTDVGWNGGGVSLKFVTNIGENSIALAMLADALIAKGYADNMSDAMQLAREKLMNKQGIAFDESDVNDRNENSEGVAVKNGYITISTIDGNVQASRAKVALTKLRLNGLVK